MGIAAPTRAHVNGDAAADGAVSGSFGSTDVPIQRVVPDGGSSVILLGLALLGLGGFACRKSVI